MTEAHAEAVDMVHLTILKHKLQIRLKRGEIQLINNLAVPMPVTTSLTLATNSVTAYVCGLGIRNRRGKHQNHRRNCGSKKISLTGHDRISEKLRGATIIRVGD